MCECSVWKKPAAKVQKNPRWWAWSFALSYFQPICPRPPLDLEYTSVSGDLHPTPHWLLQPPRLLYDRAASYGSFIILSEGMIFNFQGTVSRFGFLPVWGVALAVTIVYLKTEHILRTRYVLFLSFFYFILWKNRTYHVRFFVDALDIFTQKRSRELLLGSFR